MSMRRVLGPVLPALTAGVLVLSLAGCGDSGSGGSTASDPAPTSSASASASPSPSDPTSSPASVAQPAVVELVSETAAGGTVGVATALDRADALATFLDQFRSEPMKQRLTELYQQTTAPAGTTLYAAVVAIGCDPPTDVTVSTSKADGGVDVTAVPVKATQRECLAPVTTVAVVTVPTEMIGSQITHGPVVDGTDGAS